MGLQRWSSLSPVNTNYSIRLEQAEDIASLRALNEAAFGQPLEAQLVDRLRQGIQPWHSWVAEQEGSLVGHILFTPVSVHGGESGSEEEWTALGLGPMGVLPGLQKQGIGSALIRTGLEALRGAGEQVVFVLGHPSYYPRFGFVPAGPLGLTCKWPVPDGAFMVAELEAGALQGRRGRIEYHPAFDEV